MELMQFGTIKMMMAQQLRAEADLKVDNNLNDRKSSGIGQILEKNESKKDGRLEREEAKGADGGKGDWSKKWR